MNCRRVEKLIPLYVEGDLASGIADRLASHLEWCGRCNWLADEYKESQSWLRSSEPPEFDEASLTGLKAGVLRRIAETSAKPSLLASLAQQWSRRQVFALSAAMLIIFGVVVFYIYQARMSVKLQVVEAVKQAPDTEGPPSNEPGHIPDTGTATGAGLSKPHHSKNLANIRARAGTPIILEQTFEPPFVSQMNPPEQSGTSSAGLADKLPGDANDPPGMLRIEIQTSDPNIRIIWFAPKEVESPKTNQ
jgi:hypothetical protein